MLLFNLKAFRTLIKITNDHFNNMKGVESYLNNMYICTQVYDICIFIIQNMTLIVRSKHDVNDVKSIYDPIEYREIQFIMTKLEKYIKWIVTTFENYRSLHVMESIKNAVSDMSVDNDAGLANSMELIKSLILFDDGSSTNSKNGQNSSILPAGVSNYIIKTKDDELFKMFDSDKDTVLEKNKNISEMINTVLLLRTGSDLNNSSNAAIKERIGSSGRKYISILSVLDEAEFSQMLIRSFVSYLKTELSKISGEIKVLTKVYNLDFSKVLSKYTGESELNFDKVMNWFIDIIKNSNRNVINYINFNILLINDIDILMAPRNSNDPEHISTIKNSMLQFMDEFNKNKDLNYFAMIFSTRKPLSTGIDEAFRRRIENNVVFEKSELYDLAPYFIVNMLNVHLVNISNTMISDIINSENYISMVTKVVYLDIKTTSAIKMGFYVYTILDFNSKLNRFYSLNYDDAIIDFNTVNSTLFRNRKHYNLKRINIKFNDIEFVATNKKLKGQNNLKHYDSDRMGDSNFISQNTADHTIFLWID